MKTIYTQVSNADVVSCGKKGEVIKSEPIPLLRDKYLGEYRTALEKAKVRENLGIADNLSLKWGNIEGFVESQEDLIKYLDQKWSYSLPEDITNIQDSINNVEDALNYAIKFVSTFKGESEAVQDLYDQIDKTKLLVEDTKKLLQTDINKNFASINSLTQAIADIQLYAWGINDRIENLFLLSNTLVLQDGAVEVIVSVEPNNAIQTEGGLFVNDHTTEINTLQANQQNLQELTTQHTEQITQINSDLENVDMYLTNMEDNTTVPNAVGGISSGTKVSDLKGKSISEVIDMMLFPTFVRNLVYPQLSYNISSQLVKVGTSNFNPVLTFTRNDAGPELSREETFYYNEQPVELSNYDKVGAFAHKGIVNYDAGEYLIDNKGQVTTKRVEAGSLTSIVVITATYPWYAGNTSKVTEQTLVKFGQQSSELMVSLSGKAVIKLPGRNSTLDSFKVDGGLGYLDVDLSGWEQTTETINDYPYQVWTKKDEYVSAMSHKLKFKLSE